MDIKQFAEMLNGRLYGESVMTKQESEKAKNWGIVVVFGFSDDCVEFEGAIQDEAYGYEGTTVYLSNTGLFDETECECNCKWARLARGLCHKIKAVWHDEGGPCWTFETDIPHETFDIFEDEELFCKGIVFDINSLGAIQ